MCTNLWFCATKKYQGSNNYPAGSKLEFDPPVSAVGDLTKDPSDDNGGKIFRYKLPKGKSWLRRDPEYPFTEVMLTRLLDKDGDVLYAPKMPIPVARIYQAPLIKEKTLPIYADDPTLKISGSWFNPKDDSGNSALLTLVAGELWRQTPGPLKVKAVRSVPGLIEYPPEDYVQIAKVLAPIVVDEASTPKVVKPKVIPSIYRSSNIDPTVTITGSGFTSQRPPALRFKNGPAEEDMQVDVKSPTELVVRLRKVLFYIYLL